MNILSNLKNPNKRKRRIGRGTGCAKGKTCGRGEKGDKARSGYKRRLGQEGGQMPLFRKIPNRGFNHGRFEREVISFNLDRLNALFDDGDTISLTTLREKGQAPRRAPGGLKILGQGELTKKVTIEAHRFSKKAKEKLDAKKISYKEIPITLKTV